MTLWPPAQLNEGIVHLEGPKLPQYPLPMGMIRAVLRPLALMADVNSTGPEHAADACRYGLLAQTWVNGVRAKWSDLFALDAGMGRIRPFDPC